MGTDRYGLLEVLHQIDAYDFEHVIADLWERQGWRTSVTQGSNDRGVDVIAERDEPFNQKLAIQAKRYDPSSTVGSPDIQQYASLRQQVPNVDAVVVVTTAEFTSNAEEIAGELNVKLVDGKQLYDLFETYDAYELLYSYVNLDTGSKPKGNRLVTDSSNQPPYDELEPISVSPADNGQETTASSPDSLSDLISLRKTIADNLKTASAEIDTADSAFAAKSFDRAVDSYAEVLERLADVRSDLDRYKAGFDTVDTTAATHLDSPGEFKQELTELHDHVSTEIQKAGEQGEKAEALETLATEIEAAVETATEQLSRGDRHREAGNYKLARESFEKAAKAVNEGISTRETYRGMAEGYADALLDDTPEPPTGADLDEMKTEVEERTRWAANHEADQSYEAAANHDFLTERLLTGTYETVGCTNEPAESYLDSNEVPKFAFYSSSKGHTVGFSSGTMNRTQPDSHYGSLFLLSDVRVLIITGTDDGDRVLELSRPVDAEYSIGRLKSQLTISPKTSDDISEVHLWVDTQFEEHELQAATNYLNSTPLDGETEDSTAQDSHTTAKRGALSLEKDITASPGSIARRANGSFSAKVLKKTRGRLHEQPLIDYLAPEETLEYVLWHQGKGFRITKPSGVEETPHHSFGRGARFLMITDHRLCYVVGENGYDESETFRYDEIEGVEEVSKIGAWILKFTHTDGTTYQFPEIGTHSEDVQRAVKYIRARI